MDVGALTESTYYVLLSLLDPLHGYGIMQKVEEMSQGRVKLAPGTLYGALSSLVKKGFILELEEVPESRKREYQITKKGLGVLQGELERLKELVRNGDHQLGGRIEG